jgi:hypothetical protein
VIKTKLFILLAILGIPSILSAQPNSTAGAGAIACGSCSVARRDFWAVCNNQAAVSFSNQLSLGVFTENKFLIDELNRVVVATIIPLKGARLIMNADQFGGRNFFSLKAGLGCALQFGNHFSASIQLDYMNMAIGEGYGTYHAITFEAGLFTNLTEKISMGIHIFNPVLVRWIGTTEIIPAQIKGGLRFKPEPSLRLFAELDKSTGNPVRICSGAEYCFKEKFFIRAGITSGVVRYAFGAGIRLKRMLIDFSSSVHSWLGYSPQISFTYSFEK